MPAKAARRVDQGWKVPGTRMLPLGDAPERPAAYLLRVYVLWFPRNKGEAPPWRDVWLAAEHDLDDLHSVIQYAFEFDDDHLYEFNMGRDLRDRMLTYDPQEGEALDPAPALAALGLPLSFLHGVRTQERVESTATPLKKLGLRTGRRFGYHFDFGDDWWFVVEVRDILTEKPSEKLPKIVASHLPAPKQYADLDEDDEWDDE